MSNLSSAKQAIQSELDYAKRGFAFYTSRVDALEQALREIDRACTGVPAGRHIDTKSGAREQRPSNAGLKSGRSRLHADGEPDGAYELPSTGGDFWPDLISSREKSGREILASAIAKLGFTPSSAQIKKLSARMTTALNNLVKANIIKDTGSGRARRFYRISH